MKKVVLITGCSSGFGYGLALKFARNGHPVYATIRTLKSTGAKELSDIAKKEALPLTVLHLNVTDAATIQKAITYILKEEDRIDVLINNAGYGYLSPVEEVDLHEMKDLYETNVFGVIRMIKAVTPIMRKQRSGTIINFSSINGIVPFPLFSIYSSTKYAIETLTEGLRFELKHFGINVTMVEPGSYLTNFANNRKSPQHMRRTDSPYKELLDYFFERYKKTHDQSKSHLASKTADPQEVIDMVYQLALNPNPPLRTRIGNDARKNYWIRKLLPYPVWEKLLRTLYRW